MTLLVIKSIRFETSGSRISIESLFWKLFTSSLRVGIDRTGHKAKHVELGSRALKRIAAKPPFEEEIIQTFSFFIEYKF